MKIIILDSGIGGISVLKPLIEKYPYLDFEYFADNANCPYGEKNENEIKEIILRNVNRMLITSDDILILACNTASIVALDEVRLSTQSKVIGVFPQVELLNSLYERTLFLGTKLTVQKLNGKVNGKVILDAPQSLPSIIERYYDDEIVFEKINKIKEKYDRADIKNIYLGCTHFSLIKNSFQKIFGKYVNIIDGADFAIKEIEEKISGEKIIDFGKKGKIVVRLSLFDSQKLSKILQIF